jgi:hypothetical protein
VREMAGLTSDDGFGGVGNVGEGDLERTRARRETKVGRLQFLCEMWGTTLYNLNNSRGFMKIVKLLEGTAGSFLKMSVITAALSKLPVIST